jgi:hypothetical protein
VSKSCPQRHSTVPMRSGLAHLTFRYSSSAKWTIPVGHPLAAQSGGALYDRIRQNVLIHPEKIIRVVLPFNRD